jgi:ParB/RepB/Spo0J family partition protein
MSDNKVYSGIEMVDPALLKPNSYNPNIMTSLQMESLVADFRENGWIGQPVVVNNELEIIDGYHRWKAGLEVGFQKIPIVKFQPENEEHQKIVTIALNSKRGEMNPMKLAELILELRSKFSFEELSVKLGQTIGDLKDKVRLFQMPQGMLEKLKKDAEIKEGDMSVVLHFVLSKEQESVVMATLEKAEGRSRTEKLLSLCEAYIERKKENAKV